MNQEEHSDAPWIVEEIQPTPQEENVAAARMMFSIKAADGIRVCGIWARDFPYRTLPGEHHKRKNYAMKERASNNARLIRSAPELLESLKMMVGCIEGFPDMASEPAVAACMKTARATLDKVG